LDIVIGVPPSALRPELGAKPVPTQQARPIWSCGEDRRFGFLFFNRAASEESKAAILAALQISCDLGKAE
jgi:hypothetical protein